MKKNRFNFNTIIFFLLASFMLTSTNAVGKLSKRGRGYEAVTEHEFKAAKNGALKLDNIVGDVSVDSWSENKVRIVERMYIEESNKKMAEKLYERYTLQFEEHGKTIKGYGPGRYRDCSEIMYDITLPENFNGEINTAGGEFNIKNLKGDYSFNTSGGDVVIRDCSGNMECTTSGGELELVKIKGSLTAKTSGGDIYCSGCGDELELKTSGGELTLKDLSGNLYARTSGGDIALLQFNGVCDIKTSGGEVTLKDVESSKTIHASTSGGDIEAVKIVGDLRVKTSGGNIEIDYIKGSLYAKTSGGDIEISKVSKNVDASTSGGDVEIEGAEGYVEASTSGGDVNVDIAQYHQGTDQHIDISSSGGDILLTLPTDFRGSVDAVLKIKGGSCRKYDIHSDFSLKIERLDEDDFDDDKRKSRRYHYSREIIATGDINGGGNLITIRTVNGNIKIKKR